MRTALHDRAFSTGVTTVAEQGDAGPELRAYPPEARAVRRRRRRLGRVLAPYLLTIAFLLTVNFFLPRAMPGDPVSALLDPSAATYVADDAARAELEAYYGLDRPLPEQYLGYLGDLAQGDLGTSIRYRAPVAELLAERLPWTLLLATTALGLASVVGVVAGIHSGWGRGGPLDRSLLSLFLGVRNFPAFFLASVGLFVFSVQLGWFPLAGATTPFSESLGALSRLADIAHHLVLPATVMAVQFSAFQYLVMRAAMVSELGADYLLLGRAKGLHERRLKYRYAARNALLPVVSLTGVQFGFAVSGVVIFVETVFAYPGVGRLLFEAVGFQDYPTLQGCFLVLTLLVVAANLVADVVSARLDPRITR